MARKEIYGWQKDKLDSRDYKLKDVMDKFCLVETTVTPDLFDGIRPELPPCYDQGQLGSCGLNAGAAIVQLDQYRQKEALDMPSRLFMYFNVRVGEHTTHSDSGVQIRDVIASLAKDGFCSESLWPYNISKFTTKPPVTCYTQAKKHKALTYARVSQKAAMIEQVLASGYPIEFGFSVYDSFESEEVAKSGVVPMPDIHKEQLLGGHAVVLVGYDRTHQMFIVRNSWGPGWGDNGYFHMPYAFVLDPTLASDFWVVNIIS